MDQLKGERLAPIVPHQIREELTRKQIYASLERASLSSVESRPAGDRRNGPVLMQPDSSSEPTESWLPTPTDGGFADTKAIAVMTDDGRVFPVVSVLAADRRNDVAVVKVDAENLYPLPIARDINVGERLLPLASCPGLRRHRNASTRSRKESFPQSFACR